MESNLIVTILISTLFIFGISLMITTSQIFAQTSPLQTNSTSGGIGLNSLNALKKLESIPSLTNIVGISMVNWIKLSGIYIGDSDLTVTLKCQLVQNTVTNKSLPVTVIASKLPVANLTQLLSLVGSSKTAAMASMNPGSMNQMFGQSDLNSVMGNNALQLISLVKDMQIGAANIVSGNWSAPQTVSIGLIGGGLLTSPPSPSPNEFITVIAVPFLGTMLIHLLL